MDDAYLYFTAETGDAVTLGVTTFTKTLLEDKITELGKGHQKFIEIWSDGGFTSAAKDTTFVLMTGVTSPGSTDLMNLLNTDAKILSVAGLKAKVPLPSVGLEKYISLRSTGTELTAAGGAKIMARIVLNP